MTLTLAQVKARLDGINMYDVQTHCVDELVHYDAFRRLLSKMAVDGMKSKGNVNDVCEYLNECSTMFELAHATLWLYTALVENGADMYHSCYETVMPDGDDIVNAYYQTVEPTMKSRANNHNN